MTTKLTNFWQADAYAAAAVKASTVSDSLIASGLIQSNGVLSPTPGGLLTTLPFMRQYAADDVVINDGDALATGPARASEQQVVPLLARSFIFGSANIVTWAAGADPLGDASAQAGATLARNRQAMVTAMLAGVHAENVANDSSDLVSHSASTSFSFASVADARAAMGDIAVGQSLVAIMRTVDFFDLVKADGTAASSGAMLPSAVGGFASYMGMNVVINDNVPANTMYIATPGFIQAGNTFEAVADDAPRAGNGGGQEFIVNRHYDQYAPSGYSYIGAVNPANTVLDDAASWNRVAENAKAVGLRIHTHA